MIEQNNMTNGHLRNIQQLAVFRTSRNDIYAINIAKVKAFLIKDEIKINEVPSNSPFIGGVATIRGEAISYLNLENWLYGNNLSNEEVEKRTKLIIFCDFHNIKMCFAVKDMIDIVEKTTEELIVNDYNNNKITYSTYINNNGKKELCLIFNAEQLLTDVKMINTDTQKLLSIVTKQIKNPNKKVLVAEDSNVARDILENLLKLSVTNYEIFKDGNDLINYVTNNYKDIGLIISDIEMPNKDGYQVVNFIKTNSNYSNIPIIINSSMTSESIITKMNKMGANYTLAKTDLNKLYELIRLHCS